MGEVLPHFVQQPHVARGAGAGDAVEGDHGCGVPPRGWRVASGAAGVSPATQDPFHKY
jgi:hypothetical protein